MKPEVKRLWVRPDGRGVKGVDGADVEIAGRLAEAVGRGAGAGCNGRPETIDGAGRLEIAEVAQLPADNKASGESDSKEKGQEQPATTRCGPMRHRHRGGELRGWFRDWWRDRRQNRRREFGHRRRGTKLRNVGAAGQLDDQLAIVGRVVIVLHQTLADFAGGDADDGVGVGIIAGSTAEYLNADAALLELRPGALEGLIDGIGQKHRVA